MLLAVKNGKIPDMVSVKVKNIDIHVGDIVRVFTTVVEGAKTRVQVFDGIVIAFNGRGENNMMTVRHIGPGGIGVERKWPVNARSIVKVEVKKPTDKIRRSKLYYLRERTGTIALKA